MKKALAAVIVAFLTFGAFAPTADAARKPPRKVSVVSVGYDADGWRYLNLSSGVRHYDELGNEDGYFDHAQGKVVCPAGWALVGDFDPGIGWWTGCM